jgi:hypothetical protein
MLKEVKEVVKTVKEVKVELNKVDKRTFNPGRPKSEAGQKQEQFVFDLTNGIPFTVEGLSGEFELILNQSNYLKKNGVKVGRLTNIYPSKLKFETTTLIGNTVDYVIKYKDIVLK